MLLFRPMLCFKVCCVAIYLIILFQYVHQFKHPKVMPLDVEPAVYDSTPTYEYISLYRLKADIDFENSLEKQLIELEKTILSAASETLLANRTIWQIASPSEKIVWSTWAEQWKKMNPDWTHKILLSPPDDFLSIFKPIPEIEFVLNQYASIRKDLLRHLLLWYYGGMYTSIDTWSRIPMSRCPPIAKVIEENLNVSLMIGVEIDEPFLSQSTLKKWGWARNFGFSQDVIWAPRRFDPILRKAIVRSISHARIPEATRRIKALGSEVGRQVLDEISGAAMFTDIVLENLDQSLSYDDYLRDRDAGVSRRVSWKKFNRLKYTIWIEINDSTTENMNPGLAILPIDVWANGQKHSHAGHDSNDDACVNQLRITSSKGWGLGWRSIFA